MSTKCQTRWSNNYNCFQRRCIQRVSFCLCRVCLRDCERSYKKTTTKKKELKSVQLPEFGANERDGNKMLWHPLHVSSVALESPSPIFIPSSHPNQPLRHWLFVLAKWLVFCCVRARVCAVETHPHALFLFSKHANPRSTLWSNL